MHIKKTDFVRELSENTKDKLIFDRKMAESNMDVYIC